MKLFHRKIGKSVLVLFLDMALVFTAAFLVLVNLQTRQELEESSRGFYSEEAVSLYCTEENWDGILDILEEGNWKNGILYRRDLEVRSDTRGVFYERKNRGFPLLSGRFFTEGESLGKERIALIGRNLRQDLYGKDGRNYIEILGEPFEVIGVLGSAQPTRLDRMQLIPMGAAAELSEAAGTYVVDGTSRESIQKNVDLMKEVMSEPWSGIEIPQEESGGGISAGWFTKVYVDTIENIYLAIVLAFILNMVLACSYWARSRVQKIHVKKMLGFSGGRILLGVLGEYLKISGVSLLAAGVLLGVLTGLHVVTAVRLTECIAAEAGILLGGMAVAAIRLFPETAGKKIVLKRA